MIKASIVVALTHEGVIGNNNKLPWHLPEDLKHFRRVTAGHTIVMGRKTWESIGRKLPERLNIVVTRKSDYPLPEGVQKAPSLEEAFQIAELKAPDKKLFLIGGAQIFNEALGEKRLPIERLYLTWIEKPFEGDTFFPLEALKDFKEVERKEVLEPFPHAYCEYVPKP